MIAAASVVSPGSGAVDADGLEPRRRVLLDAHNAYPEGGRWTERLDRAISAGLPLAIEQDLVWYVDPRTGRGRSIVSHGSPFTGGEPSLDEYFFERIRPLVERALADDRRDTWPLIVLNLDLKTDEPVHHAAIWDLLGRYERWLSTAERRSNVHDVAPIDVRPVLVLTGSAAGQETTFHDRVAVGDRLRLFGAVRVDTPGEPGQKTNYRRWWNNPWSVVEAGGQEKAGEWSVEDERRLREVVARARQAGLWIRFYTLNGHDPADTSGGWSPGYHFGSRAAAEQRWDAAIHAGVDFIAVDQKPRSSKDCVPGGSTSGRAARRVRPWSSRPLPALHTRWVKRRRREN